MSPVWETKAEEEILDSDSEDNRMSQLGLKQGYHGGDLSGVLHKF